MPFFHVSVEGTVLDHMVQARLAPLTRLSDVLLDTDFVVTPSDVV